MMKTKIIGVGIAVLALAGIYAIGVVFPGGEGDNPDETASLAASTTPHPTVEETIREGTSYIEIRTIDGRRVVLYPEDRSYPAIEAECRAQVEGIKAQYKTSYPQEVLAAMKRNGTSVTIHFSEPTHFVTSYLTDGSAREITIEEALFFLDREENPEMVITPSQNGSGVWDSSRLRARLAALVVPVLVEEMQSGALANLTFAQVDFPPVPETVPLYRLETAEVTEEMVSEMAETLGIEGTVREAYDEMFLSEGPYSLEVNMHSGRISYLDLSRWSMPNPRDLPEHLPSDEEAVEIATAYLEEKGLMPADAVACDTEHAQIISTDEDGKVVDVSHESVQVSFCRKVGGREVAGSELTVDVGGGGDVIGVYKLWRDCIQEGEVSIITPEEAFKEVKALGVPHDPMIPQTVKITGIELVYYEAQAMETPSSLAPVYLFTGEVVDGNTSTPFVRYVAAAPGCRGEVPLVKAAAG